jgi:hypothetical protein
MLLFPEVAIKPARRTFIPGRYFGPQREINSREEMSSFW